jgi:hypothetical protein
MNLRDLMRPYTTLHTTKIVLMPISVQVGTRILNRSFGHSVGILSAIVGDGVWREKQKNKMANPSAPVYLETSKYML